MIMTVEIPALDRLCGILEGWQRAGICQEIEDEIVGKLEAAAKGGVPKPEFKEVPAGDDHPWKGEAKAEATAAAGTSSDPAKAVPPSPEGKAEKAKAATLADVQKAAAQMRDEGKLGQVTGMFGEFGIKKLSDLKGDALQQFAAKLREMGARI